MKISFYFHLYIGANWQQNIVLPVFEVEICLENVFMIECYYTRIFYNPKLQKKYKLTQN